MEYIRFSKSDRKIQEQSSVWIKFPNSCFNFLPYSLTGNGLLSIKKCLSFLIITVKSEVDYKIIKDWNNINEKNAD